MQGDAVIFAVLLGCGRGFVPGGYLDMSMRRYRMLTELQVIVYCSLCIIGGSWQLFDIRF